MSPTPTTSSTAWSGGTLQDLREDECWSLLEGQTLGRIAWTGPDGPVVVPVNIAVAARQLWIRTTAYAALVREADEGRVAVECDSLDDPSRSGWSVVVKGTAQVRYPGDDSGQPPALDTWPAGPRPLWVVVRPREVTGRRLLPAPAESC